VRFTGMTLPAAGSPVVAQIVRDRAALRVEDARRAPEWSQVVRELPVHRALLVPAVSWGRILGCLLFGREAAGLPFRDRDLLLAEAVGTTRYLIDERRLQIVTELPPDLPELLVDRSMVARVLVNLIGNAVKFTPPGGTISLSARAESPGWVSVTVADTGEGIP